MKIAIRRSREAKNKRSEAHREKMKNEEKRQGAWKGGQGRHNCIIIDFLLITMRSKKQCA
jgi:hypothetical protein